MKSTHRTLVVLATLFLGTLAHAVDSSKIQQFAKAIAKAEGFGVKGSVATRYHNPGNMKALTAHSYPGQCGLEKRRGYIVFCNDNAGWQALYRLVARFLDGESTRYNLNMTFFEFGKRYAGPSIWAKNVSKNLGVSVHTALWEFFEVPPLVRFQQNHTLMAEVLR